MSISRLQPVIRPGIVLGLATVATLLAAIGVAPAAPAGFFAGTGGPVARWKMDEGTGTTTTDLSGNGNTATFVGGSSWTTGQFGSGIAFNGSTGYLTVANSSSLAIGTGSFTVSAWVNTSNVSTKERVINKWTGSQGFHFDLNGSSGGGNSAGSVRLRVSDGTSIFDLASSSVLTANTWIHVAATVDRTANQVALFANGVSVATQAISVPNTLTNTIPLLIGGLASDTAYFTGSMDEVRFYTRPLSSAEVAGLASQLPLEALWPLDEGTGTSTADTSGNGNLGTLNGGVTWTTGKSGNALSFDGSTGNVTAAGVQGLPTANAPQSVSWWMNYASVPGGTQGVVCLTNTGSSSGVQCGFRAGQVAIWKWGGTNLAAGTAPSANAWHHFAYTFDGTTHTLYVDGSSINSSTTAAQTAAPTALSFGFTPTVGECRKTAGVRHADGIV